MRYNRTRRLTEGRLRGMIRNAVNGVLREAAEPRDDFWATGDINPRAIKGFRKDAIGKELEHYKRRISEYCENIKDAALGGDEQNVEYYSNQLINLARLISDFNLEDLRKVWKEPTE